MTVSLAQPDPGMAGSGLRQKKSQSGKVWQKFVESGSGRLSYYSYALDVI